MIVDFDWAPSMRVTLEEALAQAAQAGEEEGDEEYEEGPNEDEEYDSERDCVDISHDTGATGVEDEPYPPGTELQSPARVRITRTSARSALDKESLEDE